MPVDRRVGRTRQKEDKPLQVKAVYKLRKYSSAALAGLQAISFPSLHSYFFWSWVIYLTVLIVSLVYRPRTYTFFCNVSPTDEGQGCENCPDHTLLCASENACYVSAVNATYHVFAYEPHDRLHYALQESATDEDCLSAIESMSDSAGALDAVVAVTTRQAEADSTITHGCLHWNCEVLSMAMGRTRFPSSRPDIYGVAANCPPGILGNITFTDYCPITAATAVSAEAVLGSSEDLPDYDTGKWGRCMCLQRCMPGMRKRKVTCQAAECKPPKPANIEPCTCSHCARCRSMDVQLLAIQVLFGSQAGVALLSFLAYLSSSTLKEENLVKVSWLALLPGFFCKYLPPLAKYAVVASLVMLLVMGARIYANRLLLVNFSRDCWASEDLRALFITSACLWVVQLSLSTCARRFARAPPWLFSPQRAGWGTHIAKFFAFFGP